MKLSKMSIQRPVTTVMLILIAVLLGTISIRRLPVDLLPQFSLPYAIVMTQYSGAGPHEIETLVTRPLEGAVATVSNAKILHRFLPMVLLLSWWSLMTEQTWTWPCWI